MNMFGRLIRVLLTSWLRPRAGLLEETAIGFRVWLTDLDALWHMNNGKYLTIMDLARVDMMIRTGLFRSIRRHGWYPVIASETIRFRKSLRPFQRFEIRTQTLGWDERSFYLRQTFYSGGDTVAVAIVRARFLAKGGGSVAAGELVETIAPGAVSPPLPTYIDDWQQAEGQYAS